MSERHAEEAVLRRQLAGRLFEAERRAPSFDELVPPACEGCGKAMVTMPLTGGWWCRWCEEDKG